MANALECYLNDFYNDPNNVEEYKINFLKNHYYLKINIILNTEFKNFKIGIKKNKNVLWFIDKNKPNNEVIYNIKDEEFFIKNNNKVEKIDYNSSKIKEKTINQTCYTRCILS
tara:strand:- start:85 stop:423 length:339 start_codon:yes stop_codon:yes gene_type:complete